MILVIYIQTVPSYFSSSIGTYLAGAVLFSPFSVHYSHTDLCNIVCTHQNQSSIYTFCSLCFFLASSIYHNNSFIYMALFLVAMLILSIPSSLNAWSWPPSPGYWPSSKFRSFSFYQGFRNLWGPQHQKLDQNALTIWLDSTSGSFIIIYFTPKFNS